MSHFVVVVALPGHLSTHDELNAALDAALAPYDEKPLTSPDVVQRFVQAGVL